MSGNKTLAVDFGSSQDAFLRQSLDLAVSGSLAPGVRLTGVLSDRDLPLNAGGTTEGLQSLDRVLSELDHLCAKDNAQQVMSKLLRTFDVLTGLSAWSDPKQLH